MSSQWIGKLASAARSQGLNRLAYSYRLAMVTLVLVLSGGFFTISASASSQPGDLLYGLRLGLERAGLTFPLVAGPPFSEGEQPVQVPSDPWEYGHFASTQDDSNRGYQNPNNNDFSFAASDPEDLDKFNDKEAAQAERDAAMDLKEQERIAAKAEKDAEKDLNEAERETAQDLKEEEKSAAEIVRETEKEERIADRNDNQRPKEPKPKDK
jgi:hypothetical protein